MNLDKILCGPVGIDAGFKEIYNNKRERYEGKMDGDETYFYSIDLDNNISEEE